MKRCAGSGLSRDYVNYLVAITITHQEFEGVGARHYHTTIDYRMLREGGISVHEPHEVIYFKLLFFFIIYALLKIILVLP